MASGYVLAGYETLFSIIDRFIRNPDLYRNQFTKADISKIFTDNCDKFLHSFGSNFKGKKKINKYIQQESEVLTKCRDFGFSENANTIVDSGGFQISVGILNEHESNLLYKIYYEFLEEHVDKYQRAFILDVPPGPGCKIFNNFDDVYRLNFESYMKAKSMPQNVRDKIIYIHHFRTPKLWDIYTSLLNHENMFDSFKYHATGGIVANMGSDISIPCIIYVLPLIPLINQAIKFKRKELHFHILGGATHRDILFYELFKKVVMEEHRIELFITYDSSTIFKGFMVGRYIPIPDGEKVIKMDLRTDCLPMRFNSEGTVKEVYMKRINEFAVENNLKEIIRNEIYDPNTGTFYEDYRMYSMLYMISFYDKVEKMFREKTDNLYEIYKSGDLATFTGEINTITKNINSGRMSKKQTSKSTAISRSMDMLKNLDENYCKYIVNKFLSKDEFVDLTDKRLLRF